MATYAISDLHGMLELWELIQDNIKPEDTLIFLGDAADRGSDGIQIMKELLERPNTIYLMGNHEDMMLSSLQNSRERCNPLWIMNGGISTFNDFMKLNEHEQNDLMNKLNACKMYYKYENPNGKIFLCSHSGSLIDFWDRTHYLHHEEIEDDVIVLHGHTPISYLRQYVIPSTDSDFPFLYDQGHKCCIDCGSYQSGQAILLNLDTLEATLATMS